MGMKSNVKKLSSFFVSSKTGKLVIQKQCILQHVFIV